MLWFAAATFRSFCKKCWHNAFFGCPKYMLRPLHRLAMGNGGNGLHLIGVVRPKSKMPCVIQWSS